MIKKIYLTILLLTFGLIIYISHQASYSGDIKLGGFSFSGVYKNFYKKFFYLKNENPTLVRKNEIIKDYITKCHQEKKNCLIIPHQQFYADLMWISSIQYVGSLLVSTRMPYLYGMLDNLTNLSPYWTYPYFFGLLVIPISKSMYKDYPLEKKKQSWINAIRLGEKGIFFTCEQEKIKKIADLPLDKFYEAVFTHTGQIWEELKKPCKDYQIPSQ
jgi:hypothetical protein